MHLYTAAGTNSFYNLMSAQVIGLMHGSCSNIQMLEHIQPLK